MSGSLYRCRPLVLTGVFAFWAICLIEGTPISSVAHKKLDDFFNPLLVRTSLWQADWPLFAPIIDNYNAKLECVITWDDGTQSVWSHPDWADVSLWQRVRAFRRMAYYDTLITPSGQQAWPGLANAAVNEMAEETGKTPRLAEVILYGDRIDSPDKTWRKAYTSPPFNSSQKVFTWYPNAISESEIRMFGH